MFSFLAPLTPLLQVQPVHTSMQTHLRYERQKVKKKIETSNINKLM
jgi:hypothetical protein